MYAISTPGQAAARALLTRLPTISLSTTCDTCCPRLTSARGGGARGHLDHVKKAMRRRIFVIMICSARASGPLANDGDQVRPCRRKRLRVWCATGPSRARPVPRPLTGARWGRAARPGAGRAGAGGWGGAPVRHRGELGLRGILVRLGLVIVIIKLV